jgi:hypothetical protein
MVRVPGQANGHRLCVTPPTEGAETLELNEGEAAVWPTRDRPDCTVVFPRRFAGQTHCALIAWRPTALDSWGKGVHFAGDWILDVAPSPGQDSAFHFYIARSQQNPGALPRALQGRFSDFDERYDPRRALRRNRTDLESKASAIRREGSITTLATLQCDRVTVVGAFLNREGDASLYSSDGPAAGGNRIGVDRYAPADESFALPGIRVAGSRSGDTVRVSGTSFASPQIARKIADGAIRANVPQRRQPRHVPVDPTLPPKRRQAP